MILWLLHLLLLRSFLVVLLRVSFLFRLLHENYLAIVLLNFNRFHFWFLLNGLGELLLLFNFNFVALELLMLLLLIQLLLSDFARLCHVLALTLLFLEWNLINQLHVLFLEIFVGNFLILNAMLIVSLLVHGRKLLFIGDASLGLTLVQRWEEIVEHDRISLAWLTTLARFFICAVSLLLLF